jgi:alpha-tubulin suppressor-like RCC1 family protein
LRRFGVCAALGLLVGLLGASDPAAGATVQGWGMNNSGQVGNGTVSINLCRCIEAPASVVRLGDATQIAGGSQHTLALQSDGTVMAWGDNERGQLGDGTTNPSTAPAAVPGLADVVALAAGRQFSLALLSNGTVVAWGDNLHGQLGSGGAGGPGCAGGCNPAPAPIPGLSNVIAISAAGSNSLALLADGTVVAWGNDDGGQTGAGTGTTAGCRCIAAPRPVSGVSGAMAISAGAFGGLALFARGQVLAWGANNDGQLGTGAITTPAIGSCACLGPSAPGVPATSALAAGEAHSLDLEPNGSVRAWGSNFFGQLGTGAASTGGGCNCIPTPTLVPGATGIRVLAAGERHTLALHTNGAVDAWGSGINGQLGNGKVEAANPNPAPVPGLTGVSAVYAGTSTSFALLGPTRPLTIAFAGADAARGAIGGAGALCRAACSAEFPAGQVAILRAEGLDNARFAGFTGACRGLEPCSVTMNVSHELTATFGAPKGTKIVNSRVVRRAGKAQFGFSTPGAVTGFECSLARPRKAKRKGKAAKPRFSRCKSPVRYRKLRAGRYTFKVRARNIVGVEARPATKKFTVAPRSGHMR